MALIGFFHGSGGIRGHLPDAGREGGVAALRRGFGLIQLSGRFKISCA